METSATADTPTSPVIKSTDITVNIQNKESDSKSNEYVITDCKTDTVIVYLDRAEVSRSFKASVKEGENEIMLKELSSCIDKDSIRVEGHGPATILEVAYQTKYLTEDEQATDVQTTKAKQQKLQKDMGEAKKKQAVLGLKEHRLRKQRNVLDGFADNAMKGVGIKEETDGKTTMQTSFLSKDNLVGMTAFLDLYDRQAERLDASLHSLSLEMKACQDNINTIQRNLNELNIRGPAKEARELCILLEATAETEVELCVSYVVTNASWSPKYDVRVFSSERQMKIQYYGLIQQSSGEDWVDAKLCLSTATPSVGGTMPSLGTQKLSFQPKIEPHVMRKKGGFGLGRAMAKSASFRNSMDSPAEAEMLCLAAPASMLQFDEAPPPPPEMEIFTTEVKESITTTMYEIARRSTVPADNVGHKVTVAIIDLEPTFEYHSVPKLSSNAFLKAKVKNSSPYALLAGPTNIFLDNNFIAKSELKAVSPGEEFNCSLGIDAAIKIDYKPVNKFREQSGLISKSTYMTYKQVIGVKNTHKDTIKILISDQLPLSTEEKIKVTLQEPSIKHQVKYDPTKPIRLNSMNHVEWDLEIGPSETKEVVLKYSVEHPANNQIREENVQSESSTDC